ncbi:MAG: hypothetical protein ABI983_04975 [Acidobacteriota bacterium]
MTWPSSSSSVTLIPVDRSTALVPLEPSLHWWHEEVPETYPSGL